eukprot:scaffold73463_cov35-Tisochrysis_lutea.AAC.1
MAAHRVARLRRTHTICVQTARLLASPSHHPAAPAWASSQRISTHGALENVHDAAILSTLPTAGRPRCAHLSLGLPSRGV